MLGVTLSLGLPPCRVHLGCCSSALGGHSRGRGERGCLKRAGYETQAAVAVITRRWPWWEGAMQLLRHPLATAWPRPRDRRSLVQSPACVQARSQKRNLPKSNPRDCPRPGQG